MPVLGQSDITGRFPSSNKRSMPEKIHFRNPFQNLNAVHRGSRTGGLSKFDFPNCPSQFSLRSWEIGSENASTEIGAHQHFGFVVAGRMKLVFNGLEFPLVAGMYFSVPGRAEIVRDLSCVDKEEQEQHTNMPANGILISQANYKGLFQIGGPIETIGRLNYIDGCSDTLLISPVRKGDACLNFLHLPAGTDQTSHTHPSFRFGTIVDGEGYCESDNGVEHLTPGKIFYIPPEGRHRFRTEDKSLSVIAFHPDSDFGPDDYDHPMVNKTIVNGTPASKLTLAQRNLAGEAFHMPADNG